MIVYGWKETNIGSYKVDGIPCVSCNKTSSLTFTILGRYASLYWIPFFGFGKKAVSECSHCKNVLREKEMPEQYKLHLKELKSKSKIPFWYFIGFPLVFVLIGFVYISIQTSNKKEIGYLNSPKINDLYTYKLGRKSYTTLKVSTVTDDSIYVLENMYEVNKSYKVDEIDVTRNYITDYEYGYSKNEILELYKNGEITDVDRK